MKLVYSSSNSLLLAHVLHVLGGSGISCETRRESLGLATGDVPYTEAWAEIWVDDADEPNAQAIVATILTGAPARGGAAGWTCSCGESHEGQFDTCWKCGTAR